MASWVKLSPANRGFLAPRPQRRDHREPLWARVSACAIALTSATILIAACSDSDGAAESETQSSAAQWQCPTEMADSVWASSPEASQNQLVAPGPTTAYRCTYQAVGTEPATVVGSVRTYQGADLAQLVNAINGRPKIFGPTRCAKPSPKSTLTIYKYRFVYPGKRYLTIDWRNQCPAAISNGKIFSEASTDVP